MNEHYVLLMHVPRAVSGPIVAQLKDSQIDARVLSDTGDAFTGTFGAEPLLGDKIVVPESQLQKAREIVNITTDETSSEEAETYHEETMQRKKSSPFMWVARGAVLLALLAVLIFFFF